MKKLIIISLIIIAFVSNAQFYTQVNAGYGFPIINSNVIAQFYIYDADIFIYEDCTNTGIEQKSYKKDKIPISKSIFVFNETGYILNKKWGFSVNTQYYNNYFTKIFPVTSTINIFGYRQDTLNNTGKITSNYYASQLSITPQFSYYLNFNKLSYIISLGYTMAFIKIYETEEKNNEILNNSIYKYYYKKEIEYTGKMLNSVTLSNSLIYKLSNKISFLFTVSFTPIQFTPSTATQTYYYEDYVSEQGNVSHIIEYTEKKDLEMNYNLTFDMSNLNFSLGIRYTFGKKEKTETE